MAKSNGNRGSTPVIDQPEGSEAREQESAGEQATIEEGTFKSRLEIDLPVGRPPTGYLSKSVSAELDERQALAFALLLDGLDSSSARVRSGEHVGTARARALKWLFDQLADAYGI